MWKKSRLDRLIVLSLLIWSYCALFIYLPYLDNNTHSLSLVLIPPPHDLVHWLHSDHGVQSGHWFVLHSRSSSLSPKDWWWIKFRKFQKDIRRKSKDCFLLHILCTLSLHLYFYLYTWRICFQVGHIPFFSSAFHFHKLYWWLSEFIIWPCTAYYWEQFYIRFWMLCLIWV